MFRISKGTIWIFIYVEKGFELGKTIEKLKEHISEVNDGKIKRLVKPDKEVVFLPIYKNGKIGDRKKRINAFL